jgi:hypothetical protein
LNAAFFSGSKSTSELKDSPPKVKLSKADRKARNRGLSGTYSRKGGDHDYGMEDLDGDLDDAIDFDDTVVAEDEYVDMVYKFDVEKVRGALGEYFSNGDAEQALTELTEHLYNNESTVRFTKELIRSALDYDTSRVALGYKLMVALLSNKHINERAIHSAIEELLPEIDQLVLDMPRAREYLALFIAKTISDGNWGRLAFDDVISKLNANRQVINILY